MKHKASGCLFYIVAAIACIVLWIFSPQIRGILNQKDYEVQRVNEQTSYKIRKNVEDTARSMISSYQNDKLAYEQYKDSDNKEHQSWTQSYKQRANSTATKYNEYILKNSYVWGGNIPADIDIELEILHD
ncbi:hypothetical protein [Streptococcus suis]|uniref:hypothetical protein n=1 Tax=Streptococcus suis TaxID=1307 RepID=UPI001582FFA0|nr:hypothetical protein [Streptococcus suis]MCQ8272070.1 hypothetical protein [Streptococcus suis]MDW8720747.1 hypothetical protein [Streptococcus suis]WNF69865.1 hypothetical protein RJW57_02400 [Streptococcus suis]HEL1580457.1 hypothetical protein [Streptococcus suis]HEL1589354.1 hypothetical protein [Streptococcus suis]